MKLRVNHHKNTEILPYYFLFLSPVSFPVYSFIVII